MEMMSDRLFKPSEVHKLEDPERLTWLPPAEVVEALEIRPGMTVADIGAGTGYFALPIASAVGPQGKVFAVDLQPEMLALFQAKLKRSAAAPANVVLVEGSADTTNLESASADLVLIANVWHELDNRDSTLLEMKRILAVGGRLAILDWRPDVPQPPGPPLHHRIAADEVHRFATAAGWNCAPPQNVGRYSYLLLGSPRHMVSA
jgi:ubiquinone/menaquinone biosynthesis C-methylase UbiE